MRYEFGGLIFGGAYFLFSFLSFSFFGGANFTVLNCSVLKKGLFFESSRNYQAWKDVLFTLKTEGSMVL